MKEERFEDVSTFHPDILPVPQLPVHGSIRLESLLRFPHWLELQAGLETALNFYTLKKSLNCSWKWERGLDKF